MRRTIVCAKIIFLFSWVLLTCASCGGGGGGDGGGGGSISPVGVPIQTGQWAGDSDFGRIEFLLVPGSTNLESCKISFTGYICGLLIFSNSVTKTWDPPISIPDRNLNFEIDLAAVPDEFISIDGTFDSPGNAISGNFELNVDSESCVGTWSAAPGVEPPDTVIQWDYTSGLPIISYEYTGGILVALKFYCRFSVTEGSGNTRLDVKITDVDNDVFSETSEQFDLAAPQAYITTTRVRLGGQGSCGQYQNVFVMSSPSASSARIILINECYSTFRVDSIVLAPNN